MEGPIVIDSCSHFERCYIAGGWIIVMELYPGFSLYRGLYEFSQYSFTGNYIGSDGMLWKNLKDGNNGMTEILIIMFVEWLLVLFFAYYTDQIMSSGKSPLFFLRNFQNRHSSSFRRPSLRRQGSKVYIEMEKPDVVHEVSSFCLRYGVTYLINLVSKLMFP